MNYKFWIFCALLIGFQMNAQKNYIENLLVQKDSFFKPLFENPEKYRLQILYTKITRDQQNKPHFKTYQYRANSKEYFYPASTVKLAACILALEKINRLKEKGIDKNTSLIHLKNRDSQIAQLKDSTSQNGLPSVAQYIKKILLVSDNDAFNRLYEFLGQEYIKTAKAKGLSPFKIIWKHCIRNAIMPIITYLGPLIAAVTTGSFVVENVFAVPGLGKYYVKSIYDSDYTVVLGITIFYAAILILMVVFVDVLYGFIDPRVRIGESKEG